MCTCGCLNMSYLFFFLSAHFFANVSWWVLLNGLVLCMCDFWPVYSNLFLSYNCLLAPFSTSGGEFYWIALCCVLEITCFSSYSHFIWLMAQGVHSSTDERECGGVIWSCNVAWTGSSREDQSDAWTDEWASSWQGRIYRFSQYSIHQELLGENRTISWELLGPSYHWRWNQGRRSCCSKG